MPLSTLGNEGRIYACVFVAAFAVIALWETFRPWRALAAPAGRRWAFHAVLAAASNACTMLVFRASGAMVALAAGDSAFGVLNRGTPPYAVRFALTLVLLDLVRYAQHYLYHAVPALWRLHQVHHSDSDYDLTTGLRFHPGEALLTQGSYLALIALLAPPPLAVLVSELATVAQNFFTHANIDLPGRFETRLRAVLITPAMHRIHHSTELAEQNTNYGTIFPWWDRLLGTYRQAATGGEVTTLGLAGFPAGRFLSLGYVLALPFRRATAPAGGRDPR